MINFKIISKRPKCEICGKNMTEWNPFDIKHEHIECISERMSTKLVDIIIKQLKNNNK